MTPSELAVARLAAAGHTNAAIATARGTSIRTVANQMGVVMRKLGVGSRRALALRAELAPEAGAAVAADFTVLDPRERAVLARASGGAQQKTIALDLGIAPSTVSEALHRTRRRLGFASVVDLTRAFAEHARAA